MHTVQGDYYALLTVVCHKQQKIYALVKMWSCLLIAREDVTPRITPKKLILDTATLSFILCYSSQFTAGRGLIGIMQNKMFPR